MKFGQVVVTRGIAAKMDNWQFKLGVESALKSYLAYDWGLASEDSKEMNKKALATKDSIMGVYEIMGGSEKIWIMTDPGHKVTTILFPDEY